MYFNTTQVAEVLKKWGFNVKGNTCESQGDSYMEVDSRQAAAMGGYRDLEWRTEESFSNRWKLDTCALEG